MLDLNTDLPRPEIADLIVEGVRAQRPFDRLGWSPSRPDCRPCIMQAFNLQLYDMGGFPYVTNRRDAIMDAPSKYLSDYTGRIFRYLNDTDVDWWSPKWETKSEALVELLSKALKDPNFDRKWRADVPTLSRFRDEYITHERVLRLLS
jgi:hypothetical protein